MIDKLSSKDITIRVLSVMLALLLWFYVITEQNPDITKDITIPVRLINTVFLEKNNMVLVSDPASYKLTLRLKGKNNVLDKLNETTVDAFADLEGHSMKGDNYIKININGVPENVNILQKSSESVKVVLEPKVNTQKSVKANLVGEPVKGMASMSPVVAPEAVVINGAESQINKIKDVRIDVDITGADSEVKRILPVRVLDEAGKDIQNITIEPGNVEVRVPIENTKRVSLEMDISGQPAAEHVVSSTSVQPEEILIVGSQQALAGINSIKTEKIDITDVTSDISHEVGLIIPDGVQLVNAREKVTIYVNIEKIVTNQISIGSFEYENLPEGLELDSIQGNLIAVIRGAESVLRNAPSTIDFIIDLKNASEGSNVVNVTWKVPQGIEILEVSPAQAVVVLKKTGE